MMENGRAARPTSRLPSYFAITKSGSNGCVPRTESAMLATSVSRPPSWPVEAPKKLYSRNFTIDEWH